MMSEEATSSPKADPVLIPEGPVTSAGIISKQNMGSLVRHFFESNVGGLVVKPGHVADFLGLVDRMGWKAGVMQ